MNGVPYWQLSAVYFAYLALLGGFVPYWNLYLASELGFTPALIGQLMAVTLITRLVAPAFWGHLGDRNGNRLALVRMASLALTLLWCAIFFARGWWAIALLLLAASFFQNAILAQFEAVTVAHLGRRRDQYGRIRVWGSVGFMAAVAGLGVLFDVISLRWLPLVLALVALLTLLATLRVPGIAVVLRQDAAEPIRQILKRPEVYGFLGASFLMQVAHAPYYAFFSIFLETQDYSRSAIGGLWALGMAAEIFAFTQMHRVLPLLGERRVLLLCLLLAALRWAGIAGGANNLWLLIAMQLLHAASFAAFHAACISLVARHFGAGHHGKGQAIYGMLWGSGTALGAWCAGQAWTDQGPAAVFYSAAAVCLLAWLWLAAVVPAPAARSPRHPARLPGSSPVLPSGPRMLPASHRAASAVPAPASSATR